MKRKQVYIIAGPTASGKSGLALDLAEKVKGEIVNADAFQVYSGLKVLTARPDESEMKGIKHHLYGYADNNTQETVIEWLKKAVAAIENIENPVVVGGTGLYLSVLMNGISPMPDVSLKTRELVRQMNTKEVISKLAGYKIPIDIQRQKRALEILLETGKPIEYFQNQPKKKFLDADFKTLIILPERKYLYDRIEKRLVKMLEENIVDEVKNLLFTSATGGVMKAIGVKELVDFIEKRCDLKTASERILLATRHYAKRQITWFRHQMPKESITLKSPNLKDVIIK